jgi:predicted Fe-Mo cluster-binding NifX family protein
MMKICVTSTGEELDAEVDPRFGRCAYFLLVDPDTMEFVATPNASRAASGGAGIQAAQTVAKLGASVVITGSVGPNAYETLSAAGIKIVTGASGNARYAIQRFMEGGFETASHATSPPHAGMRGGRRSM